MALTKDLPDAPEEIIEYLRNHPDFFVEHSDILSELTIPHQTPGKSDVASLIEYQVSLLRQENSGLNQNLGKSKEEILHQRQLANAIHDLSLHLMQLNTLQALNDLLNKSLKHYYHADRFLFLVFNKTIHSRNCCNIRFLEANSKLAFMFTELFHHNKPLCDSLQSEHIEALFETEIKSIHSTALIPVQQSGWHGLLVLGSSIPDQYSHGFEMDCLNYMTMITAALIENIVSINQSNQQGESS